MATNAPTITGSLVNRMHSAARAETDGLFALLDDAALYERPIPERHRLIFYLGHIEAFDWNQVCRGALGMPSFHPDVRQAVRVRHRPRPGYRHPGSALRLACVRRSSPTTAPRSGAASTESFLTRLN